MGLLEQAIGGFGRHLQVETESLRPYREGYLTDLKQFRAFLEGTEIPCAAEEAIPTDPLVIRAFLASLYREKLRKVTISRKVAALRSFYRYLLREGMVAVNPAELIQLPRCEKYIPVVLSADEMLALLQVNFAGMRPGCRDRAMIELFYSAGIRLSELTGLNLEDVHFQEGLIKVRGKGRKERIVPFGRPARQAIEAYLQKRPELLVEPEGGKEEEALFLSTQGKADESAGRRQGGGKGGPAERHRPEDQSACAPAHLCHPSSGCGRGPAFHPGDAGAQEPLDNAKVHIGQCEPADGDLRPGPPAGRRREELKR